MSKFISLSPHFVMRKGNIGEVLLINMLISSVEKSWRAKVIRNDGTTAFVKPFDTEAEGIDWVDKVYQRLGVG